MRTVAPRLAHLWPHTALALIAIAMGAAILILNQGHFVYTLDDAYIHLAFSEQLAQGHFGLVPAQRASPSSSVLYPLLQMPLSFTALHEFQPLLWNSVALFACFALWRRLLRSCLFDVPRWLAPALALLAMLALNQPGLVFSGMEASLQITCSLAVAIGLIELMVARRLPWWLLAGIVMGPLLRYENLSVSLPALALVCATGRWRVAVLAGLAIAAALGGYALYSMLLGLPLVPGSLLVKTSFDDPSLSLWSGLAGSVEHLYRSIVGLRSDLPVLLLIALLAVDLLRRRPWPERALVGFALIVLMAQFAFGGHGSLGRYDSHAWSVGLAIAVFIHRATLQRLARMPWRLVAISALGLACLFPYTAFMAAATPLAANNIYLQQFQMRRLLVDFVKVPASVNDAGLTAYRNPYGVVDVVGLGSEAIRRLRRTGRLNAAMLDSVALRYSAWLALVYPEWLGSAVPQSWVPVAVLRLERPRVSVAQTEVTIYLAWPLDRNTIKGALETFAATLPPGARLDWLP